MSNPDGGGNVSPTSQAVDEAADALNSGLKLGGEGGRPLGTGEGEDRAGAPVSQPPHPYGHTAHSGPQSSQHQIQQPQHMQHPQPQMHQRPPPQHLGVPMTHPDMRSVSPGPPSGGSLRYRPHPQGRPYAQPQYFSNGPVPSPNGLPAPMPYAQHRPYPVGYPTRPGPPPHPQMHYMHGPPPPHLQHQQWYGAPATLTRPPVPYGTFSRPPMPQPPMPQPPMPQLGNGFIQPPQRHMQPSPQPPHLREDDDNQSGRGSALGSVYGSEHGENARVSLEIGGAAGDGERNAAPSTQNTADSKHMERPGTPDSVRSASTGTSKSNRYAPSTGGDSERLSIASDANAISDRRSTDGSSAGGLVGIPAPTPVPAGPIPPTHPLGRPAGHFPLGPQPPMVTVPASGDMPVQAIPPPMPPMGYPAMMHPAAGHGHPMNGTMMGHGTMMGTMGAGTMGYGARWPAEASFMAAPGGPGAYAASSNGSSVYGGSVRYDSDNVSIRSNTTGATGMTSGTVNSITPSMRAAWGSFGESLEVARQNAKRSNDPATLLDFAKYLIAVAEDVPSSEPDPKKAKRKQDVLFAEALKIIKKLASSSGMGKSAFPEAQFFLAECYGNGSIGLSVDHDRAFNLYVQASKQSHPASTFRTAYCYEVGAGTKRDSARALQYYRKAAALGDTAGMYKLGMILFNGLLGQAKNPREGITWLKRAAQQADEHTPHALHELGLLYEGKGSDVAGNVIIVDPSYAHDLFLRAAQLGFAPSQYKLGLCYEYGLLGLPIDPRRSIAWYTRAAEERDPEAELALSGWYLTGAEGVLKQSDQEAYLWARKAADKGLAKAEYAVGYYSEHGVGVRPDPEEARRWYLRAAGQGNKRAIQRVREMREVGAPKGAVRKGDWRKDQSAKDGECLVM